MDCNIKQIIAVPGWNWLFYYKDTDDFRIEPVVCFALVENIDGEEEYTTVEAMYLNPWEEMHYCEPPGFTGVGNCALVFPDSFSDADIAALKGQLRRDNKPSA